jgi:hypothetical protein
MNNSQFKIITSEVYTGDYIYGGQKYEYKNIPSFKKEEKYEQKYIPSFEEAEKIWFEKNFHMK